MRQRLLCSATLLLLLAACQPSTGTESPTSNATLDAYRAQALRSRTDKLLDQSFSINADDHATAVGEYGTLAYFPKGCFQDAQGNTVVGGVRIHMREARSMHALAEAGLETLTTDGTLFQTVGMVYLAAEQDGQAIHLKEGATVLLSLPSTRPAGAYTVYQMRPDTLSLADEGPPAHVLRWVPLQTQPASFEAIIAQVGRDAARLRRLNNARTESNQRAYGRGQPTTGTLTYYEQRVGQLGWLALGMPIQPDSLVDASIEIVTSAQQPAPYARLHVLNFATQSHFLAYANADGQLELQLPAGTQPVLIAVWGDNEEGCRMPFPVEEGSEASFSMQLEKLSSGNARAALFGFADADRPL